MLRTALPAFPGVRTLQLYGMTDAEKIALPPLTVCPISRRSTSATSAPRPATGCLPG